MMAKKICYPVVMKPNTDSYGGKNVYFIKDYDTLISLANKSKNFVVQERIEQHNYFKKFNPVGLNTIRAYVYKSVVDNNCHMINMALRMGVGGTLDNETAGGIHCMIRNDGFLNGYAVNKYGERFDKHPDTGLGFNEQIPHYENLKKLVIELGEKVFFARVIGFDLCLDEEGTWRAIEINTHGTTIRFSQYGGQPFFGEFTDEVIDFCCNNHWIKG
jgi:hypothetical protein